MVTINYDENNKEDVKYIEDYFFYKYFCEVLYSDWINFYKENKHNQKYYKIILKHINKYELEKACKIYKKNHPILKKVYARYIIEDVLMGFKPEKRYKQKLIKKFG